MTTQERIDAHEAKYRAITTQLLNDIFDEEKYKLNIYHTPVKCFIDLRFTATTINTNNSYTYDVEIKEYTNPKYDAVIIKSEKLKRIKASHYNERLIYLVYKDGYAYLFDLDLIDFNNIESKLITQKKIEYDDNSKYIQELLYFIPCDLAILKKPCKKYFDTYRDILCD